MLREEGLVIATDGDYAMVSTHRKGACGNCHAQASCGVLSGNGGKREMRIRAFNPVGAQTGERVVLKISERLFLKASFLVYGLPLMALFAAGAMARYFLMPYGEDVAEGIGAVAGLAALGASFVWLRRYNATLEASQRYQPVIERSVVCP